MNRWAWTALGVAAASLVVAALAHGATTKTLRQSGTQAGHIEAAATVAEARLRRKIARG